MKLGPLLASARKPGTRPRSARGPHPLPTAPRRPSPRRGHEGKCLQQQGISSAVARRWPGSPLATCARSCAAGGSRAGHPPTSCTASTTGRAGELWPHTDAVRSVPGWIRYRLSAWLGPDGTPLPSPSQQRRAEHHRQRAEQADRAAEWAALRPPRSPPTRMSPTPATARALLRAHSPAAARVMDLRAAGITAPRTTTRSDP